MKALITDVKFHKEGNNRFGPFFSFKVSYDGKTAFYNSKSKDQKNFVAGAEFEFTEEERTFTKDDGSAGKYLIVKPLNQNKQSNFGKALVKEQARYSAMCVSYAKDLVIGGRIQIGELPDYAWIMFELVREMDKSLNS
jgi:hypothetical protein